MHGLIFETSVCYWQNQPGCSLSSRSSTQTRVPTLQLRSQRKHRRNTSSILPPDWPPRNFPSLFFSSHVLSVTNTDPHRKVFSGRVKRHGIKKRVTLLVPMLLFPAASWDFPSPFSVMLYSLEFEVTRTWTSAQRSNTSNRKNCSRRSSRNSEIGSFAVHPRRILTNSTPNRQTLTPIRTKFSIQTMTLIGHLASDSSDASSTTKHQKSSRSRSILQPSFERINIEPSLGLLRFWSSYACNHAKATGLRVIVGSRRKLSLEKIFETIASSSFSSSSCA